MQYSKPPLSISDQASLLLSRGLVCDNQPRLEHYLSHVGYYRLSAYWLPFEQPPLASAQSRNHQFKPNTTFEQVLGLYIFDRKLRLLVMEAIERIEVSVRTRWASAMALRHGSHAHMDPKLFKNPWDHVKDLARVASELGDSSETFIAHYRKNYHEPYLPPIWAMVETLSLGSLSRWFKSTNVNDVKREVAKGLGMPTIEILEQVLHALTPMRNICAHHGRLWNRRFTLLLPNIRRFHGQIVTETITAMDGTTQHQPTREIYNFLVVMEHLMLSINPGASWGIRLIDHVLTLPAQHRKAMGIPEDWLEREPWKGLQS